MNELPLWGEGDWTTPPETRLERRILRGCVQAVQRARATALETMGQELADLVERAAGKPGALSAQVVEAAWRWDTQLRRGEVLMLDAVNAVLYLKTIMPVALELGIVWRAHRLAPDYLIEPTSLLMMAGPRPGDG